MSESAVMCESPPGTDARDAGARDADVQEPAPPSPVRIAELAARYGCLLRVAPSGTVLLEEAAIARSLYVVYEGILGAVVRAGKRQLILHAFVEGDAFTCMESFLSGEPSLHAVHALTPAKYLEIPRGVLDLMKSDSEDVARWLSMHHRLSISRMTRRIIELAAVSPAERYKHFAKAHPELMRRLPQYAIASMLGISPESLSRVRKRLSTKSRS